MRRTTFRTPQTRYQASPSPPPPLPPPREAVYEELVKMKKKKKNNNYYMADDDDDEDDDDVPMHRRRNVLRQSDRGFFYRILCLGCEPGCCLYCSSRVLECSCTTCAVLCKGIIWVLFVWAIISLIFKA